MGLYTGNLGNYYSNPSLEELGAYQFVSLEDIINNFRVAYVGEDKILPRVSRSDIKFHAMRGIQELSYDTFKSCKTLELQIPSTLLFPLPHDYVNYVKLTWVDSGGVEHVIYPARHTSDPKSYVQNSSGDIDVDDGAGGVQDPTEEESTAWTNFQDAPSESDGTEDDHDNDLYWANFGRRYGIDPQYAQTNGYFYINCDTGYIHFSSNISGKDVILEYISDGLGTDIEMKVPKLAEEAMYKHIAFSILNTRANVDRNIVAAFKKERFAAVRNAKIRLSNIKLEEITQVLRGKSKWIKH